ncbi:DUF58 domain-containing protein [soil metagenome]
MSGRKAVLLTLIIGFALAGEISDWRLLSELAMGLLALLLLTYIWTRLSLFQIQGAREISPMHLQVGDVLHDTITIANRSHLGKPWIEVHDRTSIPGHDATRAISLRRRSVERWTTLSICVRRGRYSIGPVQVRSSDPLGIFESASELPIRGDILIYPPVFELSALQLPFADAVGNRYHERPALVSTPSVATIREYVAGDPMNKIAWALSARAGSLMVKEFDLSPTSELWVVVDFDASVSVSPPRQVLNGRAERFSFAEAWIDSYDELAASIAASVCRAGMDQKRAAGYIGTTNPRSVVMPDSHDRGYRKILEELAVASSHGRETIAQLLITESRRFDRNRTPVVITASVDPAWLSALEGLMLRGVRPVGIFVDPAGFDPEIDTSSFRALIAHQRYPVFVVDFDEGIDAAFRVGVSHRTAAISSTMHPAEMNHPT